MAQPARYTFDREFDPPHASAANGLRAQPMAYSSAEIEAIRAEAYADGFHSGRNEADGDQQRAIADAMSEIASQVPRLTDMLKSECDRLADEAKQLALTLAQKIASAAMARTPHAEIEALLTESLDHLADQPHIAIHVNETMVDAIKARTDRIAMEKGFAGKLILLGSSDMPVADCRIEWADGGMTRDTAALSQRIDEIIARHLGERNDTPAPQGVASAELEASHE